MYKVTHQWNKLKTCVVGRSYPPEIFKFIKNKNIRNIFEKLAIETEHDLKHLKHVLENRFGVKIIRPEIEKTFEIYKIKDGYIAPPISARDFMIMIDNNLHYPGLPNINHAWVDFAQKNKILKYSSFEKLGYELKDKFSKKWNEFKKSDKIVFEKKINFFKDIFTHVLEQGNNVIASPINYMNSSFITRLGSKMIVGTQQYYDDKEKIREMFSHMYPDKKIFIVDSQGHSDGVFTPITNELIISGDAETDYSETFPDAEIVQVPPEITLKNDQFGKQIHLAEHRWFLDGFEQDNKLAEMVDYYFNNWVGNVQETAFMVNILMVDQKNAICSSDNKQVRDAMKRHGVELHIVPFRHKWFWDTGIHCLTQDLDRE